MIKLKAGDKITVVADGKTLDKCCADPAISGTNGVVREVDYNHNYHGGPHSYLVDFDGISYWLPGADLELTEETSS